MTKGYYKKWDVEPYVPVSVVKKTPLSVELFWRCLQEIEKMSVGNRRYKRKKR